MVLFFFYKKSSKKENTNLIGWFRQIQYIYKNELIDQKYYITNKIIFVKYKWSILDRLFWCKWSKQTQKLLYKNIH